MTTLLPTMPQTILTMTNSMIRTLTPTTPMATTHHTPPILTLIDDLNCPSSTLPSTRLLVGQIAHLPGFPAILSHQIQLIHFQPQTPLAPAGPMRHLMKTKAIHLPATSQLQCRVST